MRLWGVVAGAAAIALAGPLNAQTADPAPIPAPAPPPTQPSADSDVQAYYAAHPGLSVWLADEDGRAAAAKLIALLQNAQIDGVEDGPMLAQRATLALARGLPEDDSILSATWVRYAQALKAPPAGVSYGDAALQLKMLSASAILASANAASSLAAHVDSVAQVNPLYQELRRSAIAQGQQDNPHVRGTLARLRLIPGSGRAILVDAANAQLSMLEDGKAVETMKVIVGKPAFATPMLASTIHYVTFNPYWHIPEDVARRKVAPIVLKRGVGYLKAARYDTFAAFDDSAEPIDPKSIDWKAVAAGKIDAYIRQRTGPNNMMGAMKFGFENAYGIYLHDTPHKDLFAKSVRYLSLGCVRLEHADRLAAWLFGHEPTPPGDGPEQHVLIGDGVPVYITYLTARPDGQEIAFAPDVYKLDGTVGDTQRLASTTDSAAGH